MFAVMTSGGLLINQSLVSLVTPNQYTGGYIANGPQQLSLSLTVSHCRSVSVVVVVAVVVVVVVVVLVVVVVVEMSII